MAEKCKSDQIYNPKTKRCIAINGKTGKDLVKDYKDGKVELADIDLQKLGIAKPMHESLQQPAKESAKASIGKTSSKSIVKKCKSDEIYNAISKHCVGIKGSVAKKLLKQYKNGELELQPEDVEKFIEWGILPSSQVTKNTQIVIAPSKAKVSTTKAIPNVKIDTSKDTMGVAQLKKEINHLVLKSPKILSPDPNAKLMKVPIGVQHKIHNFVSQWKEQKLKAKKIQGIKDYCLAVTKAKAPTGTLSLPKPVMTASFGAVIPTQSMATFGFSVDHLDNKKFPGNLVTKLSTYDFSVNNYIETITKIDTSKTLEDIENTVDYDWIKSANEYLRSLPIEDIYTILGYTHYGDTLCHNYIKNTMNKTQFKHDLADYGHWFTFYFPLFFQMKKMITQAKDVKEFLAKTTAKPEHIKVSYATIPNNLYATTTEGIKNNQITLAESFALMKEPNIQNARLYVLLSKASVHFDFDLFWKPCLEMFMKDLNNIIERSPHVKNPMTVYRGVKTDYYLQGSVGFLYKTNTFVSTTLKVATALSFATNNGWIKRITVLPGAKCLLIGGLSSYPTELEILFGSESIFYITENQKMVNIRSNDICSKEKVKATDLVIVK